MRRYIFALALISIGLNNMEAQAFLEDYLDISKKVSPSKKMKEYVLDYYLSNGKYPDEDIDISNLSFSEFPIKFKGYSFYYFSEPTTNEEAYPQMFVCAPPKQEIIWTFDDLVTFCTHTFGGKEADMAISVYWHYLHLPQFREQQYHIVKRDSCSFFFSKQFGPKVLRNHFLHSSTEGNMYISLPEYDSNRYKTYIQDWQKFTLGSVCDSRQYLLYKSVCSGLNLILVQNRLNDKICHLLILAEDNVHIYCLEDAAYKNNEGDLYKTSMYYRIFKNLIRTDKIPSNEERNELLLQITNLINSVNDYIE